MGVDEEGTLRQLKSLRKELIDPKFTEHRGRIVKTTGDGMLVEFFSVVDAVRCAVDIQRGMGERNATVQQITALNSASASMSATLGMTSSVMASMGGAFADARRARWHHGFDIVHDQVRDKLSFGFDDMGEQSVKNIARPIGVHRSPSLRLPYRPRPNPAPRFQSSNLRVPTALNRRLPFANMSGDPEQEYFATACPKTSSLACQSCGGSSSSHAIHLLPTRVKLSM